MGKCCTPNSSNSNNVRLVNPTGTNDNNNANNTNGVAPDYWENQYKVDNEKLLKSEKNLPNKECLSKLNNNILKKQKSDSDAVVFSDKKEVSTAVNAVPFNYTDLYNASKKCARGVSWKDSVAGFVKNRLINCYNLMESINNNTYKLSEYSIFKVYEPKERDIVATNIRDRVVQRALCDAYLYKAITKSFIYDNLACQVGKGTTHARQRLKAHLQRFHRKHGINGYVLKLDIKHFFATTTHEAAKNTIKKRVDNIWTVDYINKIIDSFDQIDKDVGIALGSQISQLIELALLDDLDHFIKEKLHIKYYIRYMDDIVLIHENKAYLKDCCKKITEILSYLNLKTNDKKTYIAPIKQGISFLGFSYNIQDSGYVIMKLLPRKFAKERKKLKAQSGFMEKEKLDSCYLSWRANANQGTTYRAVQSENRFYYFLRRNSYERCA